MRRQIWNIASILFSAALYIAGNGLIGVLIPVRAHMAGFSNLALGLIGSAYFAGFVLGCFVGPRLLVRAGHSRTFAVAAGLSCVSVLMQSLFVTVVMWTAMRVMFGIAAACIYMVIESWLNERSSNDNRGRTFSAYLTINFAAIIAGQMLFGTAQPMSFALFALAGILYALCVIPIGLTELEQPLTRHVPALRLRRLFRTSPVGFTGCVAVGFANSAIWTLGPVYAQDHGLTKLWIAVFMSVFTLGGALVQPPLGRLSDRMDRRYLIALVCAIAAALGLYLAFFVSGRNMLILPLIGVFGIVALPLYGLSVAHANDRVAHEEFVETSAALLFINSLSSVGGPTLAALVMGRFGTASLFVYTAAIHVAMTVFTLIRLSAKHAAARHEPFEAMPGQATPMEAELAQRSAGDSA